MKKGFQWMALLVVAMLGACSGGSDKAAAEKVDEKPRVKLAEVSSRPVEQIQEYTATVEAEVKNNIAPSSPVRIDRIFVEVGDVSTQFRASPFERALFSALNRVLLIN